MILSQGFQKSKPIPTKKSSQCPVCGDVSGKCRTFDDKPLVLCMGAESAPGWKNLGFDRSGLWQQFVPEFGSNSDFTKYQARDIQPVVVTETMGLEERDLFYRNWLAQGSLNERDRADLERRGVTDFSIAVSNPIGYVVPFKGLSGEYVGAQWRLADPQEGGRYRWHNLEGGKYYPGTNEMPIAVYPCDRPRGIALVEGTGIKPMIAAERLEMIAIGAAGGNHVSSISQLKAVFEAFPNLPVTIVPDAGDIVNPHVMKRHQRTVATLRQWALEPKFLWWNQRTKEECDVDEATIAQIEWAKSLTFEQFEDLSECKTGTQNQPEQSERDRLISKRVLRFRQFWNDLQRDFLLPTLINGNEIRFQAYQGFAPIIDLFWDTTCLQGWLGAGKTEAMLRSLIPYEDKAIVWVAPRNGLLRQTAERAQKLGFNVYHYQDDVYLHRQMIRTDQPGIYFMAPDSFKFYAVENVDWTTKILVVDEFSGIRKEILGKTTELPHLLNAIAQCASLLVADAFLSRVDIGVIRKYRSGSIQILNQEFKKSSVKIKWLECRNRKGEISFSHEGLYYPLLDRWIEEKLGRIAIAVDSIHIAKMLDRYLKSKGVKTWIVCSETPEQNKNFMPDPDNLIEGCKVQAVIYTPTAQSGLDIQAKFDRGLLICTGTLAPTQMLQMLGRCRQCPEWYVSAPRHSGNPECVTPSLDSKKIRGWTEQIKQVFADLGFNAPLEMQGWSFWEELTRNIETAFTSEYMRHLLDHFFESVEAVEVESDRVTEWRKDSQILKNEEFEKILKANLSNGLRLIDEQKQPTLNSEVWDIKLAEFCGKYPKIAKKAISDFEQSEIQARQSNAEIDRLGGCDAIRVKLSELAANIEQLTDAIEILDERIDILKRFYAESDSPDDWQALVDARREWFLLTQQQTNAFAEYAKLDRLLLSAKGELALDAIDMTKLFHSRRVEKLKNYVSATELNEQDDRDLLQYLRERPTHYNAGNFKRLQNIKLFRSLNLGSLASIANIKEVEADVNAFRALSPVIVKLYRQFQANSKLIRLFPLIDSEKAFFDHLKACMSYLGYERGGKSIRVETEGLNQNGFDRKGNQRFSKSKTFYFVFWFLMECSGSAYFRENLELILEALRDRLATERDDRQRRREQKERYETPPPGWEAQAA
jgi:hypothetical protein